MSVPLPLLRLLADGAAHSGASLGEQLGISRAAVWKQVEQWRAQGVAIAALPGRGYQLPQAVELIDVEALRRCCDTALPDYPHTQLLYAPVMASTNDRAREQIVGQGLAQPLLVVAEYQQQGRGRRGRQWQAGFAQGLLLSVAMRIGCGATQVGGLSLACGVAVLEALQRQGIDGIQLKWPNDLLLDGGKLGGILLELSGESEGPCEVLVGIGLNIGVPPAQQAQARALTGLSRNQVAQTVATALLQTLAAYADSGFAPWRARWQRYHAYQGQAVRVQQGEQWLSGQCLGVDAQGALRLLTEQGEQCIYAGDVSLRSAA